MNNNLTKNDLSETMVRPKRLYLTSEDVQDFDDSSSCKYTLRESIIAEDGFRLVYGLKSFGYMATANSISTRQLNNKLYLELYTTEPAYLWNSISNTFVVNPLNGQTKIQPMELVVPDGFYPTLGLLFQAMNDTSINLIPSGIKKDVTNTSPRSQQSILAPNDIPLRLNWVETEYGYLIQVQLSAIDDEPIINDYVVAGVHYQAKQVNYIPYQLHISAGDESHEALYDLLFTNEASSANKPANVPTSVPISGRNPPDSVILYMSTNLSYVAGIVDPVDTIYPADDFTYYWRFNGLQDDLLTQYPVKKTPDPDEIFSCQTFGYLNLPLQIWYKPRLYPIYIEIDTSLETQNLTVDGYASNLLFRHFPLGGDSGSTSFFQQWDQPIYHHMRSARNHVDSIKIDFISESNKWEFFNMTFFIEIVFYEVPDEEELPTFDDATFQIPQADEMTSSLQQYSNNFHNPFPIKNTGGHKGMLRLGNPRSGELKKRRL